MPVSSSASADLTASKIWVLWRRGEAGCLIAEQHPAPGKTKGGELSYMRSDVCGMHALQESVRQMRGTASAQIPGAKIPSATVSAACSPPPAPSSCRTSRHNAGVSLNRAASGTGSRLGSRQ
jgi:hypothetical protein